ncbi:MAG: pyridoxal 5'-phosphate synthase glutaminase subunit PdxT [Dehalococcoidia bacterium]|nr:pyridoxal 5'-phosphate synthase glutaminase subunit PdxT [Dehalococcoidia bacterium]
MVIGILALQGDFIEHIKMLDQTGVRAVEIRLPSELDKIDGLIIPGGESTTMMKLMHSFDLIEPIRRFAARKLPLWGTCAGMICLANDVHNHDATPMETLGLMDITVKRNAFGRQVDSFETSLDISAIEDGPFPGIFIRAPYIQKAGKGVQTLASLPDGRIVAARQGNLLATSFHPELTTDTRLHRYFSQISAKY